LSVVTEGRRYALSLLTSFGSLDYKPPLKFKASKGEFMSLQLARWDSGGILLTYWCNAACADCYENSSPRKNSILPVEDAKEYLRELRQLGCTGPRFHFAGGEPFYNYRHLIDCFEVAQEEGMLPLGKLETNAFWCTNDELVRERLTEIERFGIVELLVSSDVFHQEFVPMKGRKDEKISRTCERD